MVPAVVFGVALLIAVLLSGLAARAEVSTALLNGQAELSVDGKAVATRDRERRRGGTVLAVDPPQPFTSRVDRSTRAGKCPRAPWRPAAPANSRPARRAPSRGAGNVVRPMDLR